MEGKAMGAKGTIASGVKATYRVQGVRTNILYF